ncbi:alanine--tRNA ligase-related protein [Streptomyces sp. NBC_01190]|uniref:alanine--tRNA ligase-related protein n=1 Tax=Streptomyces sp. NBC_01190 TaxID=2903767 RepID=UPI003869FF17|nr:alanine--tRNA ligase-related protein [Streptomyces sp. NBC_01190]
METTPTTRQTADTFTAFFRDRGHRLMPSASLVRPPGDPVLFTAAGMHPLTPYLEGRPHPLGRRLADVQRCLRTTDLEEVGDPTHLTVFEMLGSWSLGDYGSRQSLRWGYELLVDGFGIGPERLHATVFGGDGQTGPDDESLRAWQELGVPVETTREDNWWSNGPTGPCGPDSEIFVWTGDGPPLGAPSGDDRWVEVWNHVMMRYRRLDDQGLQPLSRPSVDTGMGLERLAMVLQGRRSVFDGDLFEPWLRLLPPLWGIEGTELRIVADHLRSAAVVIADGVTPGANGHGYVLRRLVRRVLTLLWRHGRDRDPNTPATPATSRTPATPATLADLPAELIAATLDHFGLPYPVARVREVLLAEERRFAGMLSRGRGVLARPRFSGVLDAGDYAYLHDTHGLPRELIDILRAE